MQTLARKAILLPISKVIFVVVSYGIYLSLSRFLTPAEFGIYGIINALTSVLGMAFILGGSQAVSKYTSESELQAKSIKSNALKLQVLISLPIVIIFILFPQIITKFFNDDTLMTLIRISGIIIIFYMFKSVFIGYLNGKKQFHIQGLLQILFSIIKAALIISLVFFFHSVQKAFIGFLLAAIASLISYILFVPRDEINQGFISFPMKRIFAFEIIIVGQVFILNMLLNMDIFLLKQILPAAIANQSAGFYTASLTISRIPYVVLTAIPAIFFPLISKATVINDRKKSKELIKESVRLTCLLSFFCGIFISSSASHIITFIYPSSYIKAGSALALISIGYIFLCIMFMITSIISASGKPNISLLINIICVLFQIIFCYILIPRLLIVGAALSSTLSFFVGAIIGGLYIHNKYNVLIDWKSALNIILISGASYLLSFAWHVGGYLLIAKGFLYLFFFVTALWIIKEWKKNDLIMLKSIFQKSTLK